MALAMYDLDGTLIETAEEITCAVNMTLSQHNHEAVTIQQVEVWIGHGTNALMKRAWPDKAAIETPWIWNVIMEEFNYHYNEVAGTKSKPYPQVIETLHAMKELGIKQAVITNKEQPFVSRILEKNGIESFFDLVIGGNTLPVKKPDAKVIFHCLDTLSEDAETSLFVGDSATDIMTAKNAKINCWVVPYGYNGKEDIRLSNPDKLIQDLSIVPSFFHALNQSNDLH
jgi:phosphoglycolate phosphatase